MGDALPAGRPADSQAPRLLVQIGLVALPISVADFYLSEPTPTGAGYQCWSSARKTQDAHAIALRLFWSSRLSPVAGGQSTSRAPTRPPFAGRPPPSSAPINKPKIINQR